MIPSFPGGDRTVRSILRLDSGKHKSPEGCEGFDADADENEDESVPPFLLTTVNFFSSLLFSAIICVRWRTFNPKTSCEETR